MICVDLDCTLIDSEGRYDDEKIVAADYGISGEEYVAAVDGLYRQYGTTSYSFELIYEFLLKIKLGLSKKIIDDLNVLLDKNYFFLDSEFFLSSFKPQQLVLITSGNPGFQWKKIFAHKILRYANAVTITNNKAGAVAAELVAVRRAGIQEPFFFIDDAPREIEAVKKAFPQVICIQAREPASWETQRTTEYYDVHLPDLEAATHYIKGVLSASD